MELFFSFVLLRIAKTHIKFASSKRRNRHGDDIRTNGETTKIKDYEEDKFQHAEHDSNQENRRTEPG